MIYSLPIFSFPFFLTISIFIYHYSNLLFLHGYDMWSDFRFMLKGKTLKKSDDGLKFTKLIKEIRTNLDALK